MVVSIRLLWRPMALLDSLPLPQCAILLAGRWQAITHGLRRVQLSSPFDVGDIRGCLPVCSFKACSRCSTVSGLSQVFDSFNLCRSVPTLRPPPPLLPSAHPCPILRQPVWCCLDALRLHTPLRSDKAQQRPRAKEQSGKLVWNQHPTA